MTEILIQFSVGLGIYLLGFLVFNFTMNVWDKYCEMKYGDLRSTPKKILNMYYTETFVMMSFIWPAALFYLTIFFMAYAIIAFCHVCTLVFSSTIQWLSDKYSLICFGVAHFLTRKL